MQITLNQQEIEAALKSYVCSQININDDQEIAIDLKAGRSEAGYTATLDIRPVTAAVAPKKAPTHRAPAAASMIEPAAAVGTSVFSKPKVVFTPAPEPEEVTSAGISSGEEREPVETEEPAEEEVVKPAATRTSIFSKVAGS